MRKILILLVFILSLVGINSDYFREFQQNQSSLFNTIIIQDEDVLVDFPVENNSRFFFEASHLLPIVCENPSFSLRLHSASRLLSFAISFKETYVKQFFKNRLLISETISNICLVKQLHAGYYTCGLGKLRF